MKTIRPNVFETNSSSEHTICFPCASACENLNPAPQTLIANGEGEYGWGYDVLDTPYALLDYWLVAIKDTGMDYEPEKRQAVIDYFATKQIILEIPKSVENMVGYIDHQSVDSNCRLLAGFIDNPEALFKFVFCPETKIIIDNDNHQLMKNYLYRLFGPIIEHLSEWKAVYISSILIVGVVCGIVYWYEPAPEPDTYQICPRYSGNRCELLSIKDWEQDISFGYSSTDRFYNRHDPQQIKVFRYCDVRRISVNNYGK